VRAFTADRLIQYDLLERDAPYADPSGILPEGDAADVAISTSFGATRLTRFNVVTEEVASDGIFSAEGAPQLNAA
jgi:hypothetical protein